MIRYKSNDSKVMFCTTTYADRAITEHIITSQNFGRKRVCVKYHNKTTSYGLCSDESASEYSPKIIANGMYHFGSMTVTNGGNISLPVQHTYVEDIDFEYETHSTSISFSISGVYAASGNYYYPTISSNTDLRGRSGTNGEGIYFYYVNGTALPRFLYCRNLLLYCNNLTTVTTSIMNTSTPSYYSSTTSSKIVYNSEAYSKLLKTHLIEKEISFFNTADAANPNITGIRRSLSSSLFEKYYYTNTTTTFAGNLVLNKYCTSPYTHANTQTSYIYFYTYTTSNSYSTNNGYRDLHPDDVYASEEIIETNSSSSSRTSSLSISKTCNYTITWKLVTKSNLKSTISTVKFLPDRILPIYTSSIVYLNSETQTLSNSNLNFVYSVESTCSDLLTIQTYDFNSYEKYYTKFGSATSSYTYTDSSYIENSYTNTCVTDVLVTSSYFSDYYTNISTLTQQGSFNNKQMYRSGEGYVYIDNTYADDIGNMNKSLEFGYGQYASGKVLAFCRSFSTTTINSNMNYIYHNYDEILSSTYTGQMSNVLTYYCGNARQSASTYSTSQVTYKTAVISNGSWVDTTKTTTEKSIHKSSTVSGIARQITYSITRSLSNQSFKNSKTSSVTLTTNFYSHNCVIAQHVLYVLTGNINV